MPRIFKPLILIIFSIPLLAVGEVRSNDLPAGTRWYLHADLKQTRESESGRALYNWADAEVFIEIHDKIGIDVNKEADRITAFSSVDNGTIIVLEGGISKESQDKLLALAAVQGKLETRSHKGKTFYHVLDMQKAGRAGKHDHDAEIEFDGLDDEAFFSFAIKDKLIVASSDKELQAMLDSGGRVSGSAAHSGSLFVISADKTFLQAGLKTDDLADREDGWQSNILRNTEQLALLVSESKDHIAVEAQLVSADPQLAQSIGGIINGLISLQLFNTELDPELRALIQNTRVQVKEKVLSINAVINPKTIAQLLDD
jgi:hypothetical protein